jgi:hypothetical protein
MGPAAQPPTQGELAAPPHPDKHLSPRAARHILRSVNRRAVVLPFCALGVLVAGVPLAMHAAAASEPPTVGPAATEPAPGLPASSDETGFVPLFAEGALKQWHQCGPGHFAVTNGVATGEGGMGLWWYAAGAFTNFVLRGEFVQEQEIADSGVFVRFPDPGNDPWLAVNRGHEVEIGDPGPKDPTWRTGSIYPFQASARANTKPIGQWNTYEIVCLGHTYIVRINDEIVTTWTDPMRRSAAGYVGLQNYNDGKTVRHRNVRIRALP